MTPTMQRALRALRDCGLLRVRGTNPGFAGLAASGYATALRRRVADEWVLDFRLTVAGLDEARHLPRLPGDRP